VNDKIHDAFGGTIILAGGNDRACRGGLAEGR
jgi:hypothetical protein